ncbi:unnamed protein product, partial [Rotaria magnacalcarata]
LNKSIDSDVLKAFKEFRSSSVAQNNCSPFGQNGSPSILNSTIGDFIEIHEYIDKKRKDCKGEKADLTQLKIKIKSP